MVTKVDLSALAETARAAAVDEKMWVELTSQANDESRWADAQSAANARHVAASSPRVVLALVARVLELEQALRGVAQPDAIGHLRAAAATALLDKGAVLP